jgi:hypothetical protein
VEALNFLLSLLQVGMRFVGVDQVARTRPDPFADVWAEIEEQLSAAPHLQANRSFEVADAAAARSMVAELFPAAGEWDVSGAKS